MWACRGRGGSVWSSVPLIFLLMTFLIDIPRFIAVPRRSVSHGLLGCGNRAQSRAVRATPGRIGFLCVSGPVLGILALFQTFPLSFYEVWSSVISDSHPLNVLMMVGIF